ncbi:MAG: DUF5615 family PIN-like protein [Planctomycetota bacterium]
MKILLDMNLTPAWCETLARHGHECAHWSAIGDPRAADRVIMEWAKANGWVVFTHDLDFGAILAATNAIAPSVIQLRAQDVFPGENETLVTRVLAEFAEQLRQGALLVIDPVRTRVRVLPLAAPPGT